jgi:CubicO group peptidase (beta-lactamase class C family)
LGDRQDFVGKAVEAVSGKKLDAYLKDHIFTPLGMNDTAFKIGPSQRARLVGMPTRRCTSNAAATGTHMRMCFGIQ